MEGATRHVAAWAAGLADADVPASTRRFVQDCILDTLAAGLHGAGEPWSAIVRQWAATAVPARGTPAASLWGAAGRLRPAEAALVNGVAAHAFELDDFVQKTHAGAVVVPTVLALAEAHGKSVRDVVTAVAVGYEVAIRLARALDPNAARLRGWHVTGVVTPAAAAAAGARLLGFNAERTAWALGLGATQAGGLFAFNADGAMSKRFHPGRAAQSAVMAVELAALGLTGPTRALEHADGGLLPAFVEGGDAAKLTEALGERWWLETTIFKPHASCGSNHPYIDCAIEIRERLGGPPPAGTPIRAGVARLVDLQCGYPYVPGEAIDAQMSLRYAIAVALADGAVLPQQYAPERMRDPAIVARTREIALVHDPEVDRLYPGRYAGWLEVGNERAETGDPSGSPANPRRAAALDAKIRGLFGANMPTSRADALCARIRADDTASTTGVADALSGRS